MIGPSSGTGGVPNHQVSTSQSIAKKRIFDDLDIENFCEEVQNSRKRYQFQELETSMELVSQGQVIGDGAALFSPLSAQEATEECPVARLEVLLVDGTNCTWTTVSELDSQQSVAEIAASPSTSSSSSEHRQEQVAQDVQVEETSYQIDSNYWEPVVAAPPSGFQQTRPGPPSSSQQQQYDDQETGNLSWLLDFKLDPFIEAADDRSTVPSSKDNHNGGQLNETWLNQGFLEVAELALDFPEEFGLAWPPEFI